jgi:hypothetical protein
MGREVEITAQQFGALRALVQESDPAYAPVGYVTFGLERTLVEPHKYGRTDRGVSQFQCSAVTFICLTTILRQMPMWSGERELSR